ncbi:retropepsin-like domain-containing protein [Paenibacillus sp. CFBP 13594]|uniref:retropepsin-like aspartic protease n=1 Tax=Paenibacillus sp. CFBP 13594 TaxID=2774037 RepID=UPI0017844011|nr:retropepsin-like aspartic protease [Paenibacillus sp. CFBP 13594]MBD8840933.1 retropepsin-like domain-containing protein [Paenibacillus sp. CFBP 13594]
MKISEIYGLSFISIKLVFRGEVLQLEKVLLDTGSASTLLNADAVREVGMVPEEDDLVDIIRGVGGIEYVYTKSLDSITVDGTTINDFQVEIGNMDYGLEIDGILGFNFMKQTGVIINANLMELSIAKP